MTAAAGPRVAVVLGAAVRHDGTPSPTLARRADHAAWLFRQGRIDAIVTTGGAAPGHPPHWAEGAVARARLLAAGLPAEAVDAETASTTTLANIVGVRPLLPSGARVTLVSNRWHLPRALLIARLLGLAADASGPAATTTWPRTAWAILREAAAVGPSAVRAVRWARRSGR